MKYAGWYIALGVVWIFLFLPELVSAKSDIAVLLGVGTTILYAIGGYIWFIKPSQNKEDLFS
jgi:predicted membrane channel-forming protein YqfA (hemolysin III family)